MNKHKLYIFLKQKTRKCSDKVDQLQKKIKKRKEKRQLFI